MTPATSVAPHHAPTGLRSRAERVRQTLWFEGIGLLLVAPAYAWISGDALGESVLLVAALSVVVMLWAALYNTVFDRIELRRTGRVASDRPHRLRTLHAIGLELSAMAVSCPVIYALTDLDWTGALIVDIGLTCTYAAYAYVFHLAYDALRPVRR